MQSDRATPSPLTDLRVVDLTTGIAGAYLTKLLADAGADVIKVEPEEGDPLRRWSGSGRDLGADDGLLFQFLAAAKRSVVGSVGDAHVLDLIGDADLVVANAPSPEMGGPELLDTFPGLVVVSLTPFGLQGPWSNRPWTDFTVQAASGSTGSRGWPTGAPTTAGGELSEWMAGAYAAPAALAAVRGSRRTGQGAHIDLSMMECCTHVLAIFQDLIYSMLGRPPAKGPARVVDVPSIEPTADGLVGFCVATAQQFSDFCLLIERPELADDEQLRTLPGRLARLDEWNGYVRAWTTARTTDEVIEQATLFRIPVAQVGNGQTVLEHEQFLARDFFATDETSKVRAPRPPYLLNGLRPVPKDRTAPAPGLGEHTGRIERRPRPPTVDHDETDSASLPLAGLKVVDLTCMLAGPIATYLLASLGAEVIHVESVTSIDGARGLFSQMLGPDHWWERGPGFLSMNPNKRGITLDLSRPEGIEALHRLLGWADVVVENFSPRVMDNFGLTWDAVRSVNPKLAMIRMPGYGLDGPWRDRVAMAPTIEQLSGMAWVTGLDGEPRIPRGPADVLGGLHAAFACLIALTEIDRTGDGLLVEVPLIEAALNVTAEQVLEFSAHGTLLRSHGNRSANAAPQGIYRCRGDEQWLALSVATDEQWAGFRTALDEPDWAQDPSLDTAAGRHKAHDLIDAELSQWASELEVPACVEQLVRHGVPAAEVADPRTLSSNPQLAARGFYETLEHPVAGAHPVGGMPFRMTGVDRWIRSPAPTLGQHNAEILTDLLGYTDAEIAKLQADQIVGEVPAGL